MDTGRPLSEEMLREWGEHATGMREHPFDVDGEYPGDAIQRLIAEVRRLRSLVSAEDVEWLREITQKFRSVGDFGEAVVAAEFGARFRQIATDPRQKPEPDLCASCGREVADDSPAIEGHVCVTWGGRVIGSNLRITSSEGFRFLLPPVR